MPKVTNIKAIPLLFAFTLFLSATLVFSVQPMLGKMMLPHVGGAPSGWAVTMFFFQTCLLFGYGLAYLFSKLPPFLNALSILLMFIPGALFLPIAYHSGLTDSISPAAVFVQLTLSTAIPFLALSTLAPGLQRLFSYGADETANDPYYLYAASNLGSFTGLLAYPIILEPLIGLQTQSNVWMLLYGLLAFFVILCAISVFKSRRDLISLRFTSVKEKVKKTLETGKKDTPITWKRRFMWLCLAAIPSSLMIGVTTEITTDIASAPMIWVIPLGLYLVTNIIAFSKRHTIETKKLSVLHTLGIVVVTTHIMMGLTLEHSTMVALLATFIYLGVFTITALTLHCRLANDRPSTDKLTEFYLFLALGGALGGSFNAFIAPIIFNDIYEFHAVLILSLLFTTTFHDKAPETLSKTLKIILGLSILCAVGMIFTNIETAWVFMPLTLLLFFSSMHTRTLFWVCLIVFFALIFSKRDFIETHRNFFGVTKIYDGHMGGDKTKPARIFTHGTTLHGFQAEDEKFKHVPVAYYGANGPVGDIIDQHKLGNVAVLGLGTGQIACYKGRSNSYTFFEIDPHVAKAAKEHFSVLKECGYKDIIIGDARLELIKTDDTYNTIFVDTFSSDAIPVHLITSEAIDVYFSKLKKNGVIAINISNRHLNLKKPLAAIAQEKGYEFRYKHYEFNEENPYDLASEWVIFTKNKKFAARLDKKGWSALKTSLRPWTDDYSNYMSILKFLDITDNKPEEAKK